MNAVFVYGLLKPGFSLHHLVAPFVVRAEPATVRGRLYDAGVPAARFDEDAEIDGFVLWLDPRRVEEALRVLDDVEDEGEVYDRIVVRTSTGEDAHAYHYRRAMPASATAGRSWPATARGSSID